MVKFFTQRGSLSIMIPGQDNLCHRACFARYKRELLRWFAMVETRAWKYVNTYFRHQLPSNIFLVTGQTLTDEFSITYQENESTDCKIILEPYLGIPQTVNAKPILGYNIEKASASIGFEVVLKKGQESCPLYSVYLEEYKSSPILVCHPFFGYVSVLMTCTSMRKCRRN